MEDIFTSQNVVLKIEKNLIRDNKIKKKNFKESLLKYATVIFIYFCESDRESDRELLSSSVVA